MAEKPRSAPLMVALGILASRLSGLIRETVASRLLGNSAAADAFSVAMRIPNLLQNLLGEGVLSASFVPVYSFMLNNVERTTTGEKEEEANRVAGAVAALLMTVASVGVLLIVTFTRPAIALLAPGLGEQRFELAVSLTRITAVGVGFAVVSAWCLGVLNSHRHFFVSYVSPVVWNTVQIGALVAAWILAFDLDDIARALAWGATVGSLTQVLFQLPIIMCITKGIKLNWGRGLQAVRDVIKRFMPTVLGRGVVQLTSYIDLMLASLLAAGALAALARAQILYTLPISLFALSIAAAELPEMSRQAKNLTAIAKRAQVGARKVTFLMLYTAATYIAIGDLLVNLLFEGGLFSAADTKMLWFTIAVYGIALPATGINRILQNTCYALGNTSGPAWIATIRVTVAAIIGALLMFPLDRVVINDNGALQNIAEALQLSWALPDTVREIDDVVRLGIVGLAAGSAVAAWVEAGLLVRLLNRKLEKIQIGKILLTPIGAAVAACVSAIFIKLLTKTWPVLLSTPLALGVSVCIYTLTAHLSGVEESRLILNPVKAPFKDKHN
ncbi:MAG: murein biosynthesis integral membrane protein MurJ [Acidimicrobiaceae bacterium]|nr:murein biosynthesis integral membrane protein MurJ [Acidimicrobiaceae bacterium]